MLGFLRVVRAWLGARLGVRGAATAEYALLLALVVIVLIGALSGLGNELVRRLQEIIDELKGAGAAGG